MRWFCERTHLPLSCSFRQCGDAELSTYLRRVMPFCPGDRCRPRIPDRRTRCSGFVACLATFRPGRVCATRGPHLRQGTGGTTALEVDLPRVDLVSPRRSGCPETEGVWSLASAHPVLANVRSSSSRGGCGRVRQMSSRRRCAVKDRCRASAAVRGVSVDSIEADCVRREAVRG
jgi:hypothetical protein